MKRETIQAVAAALASLPLALCALELSDKSDIRFAEAYAFSTNRAAMIATLPPESKAWFSYSILDAQTEGRLDDAVAMLKNAYRLDPYSEQLVYEMLSCYSASGKPDKAKSCYEEFCARLDAEFGTRPGKWLRNHFFSCFSDEAYQKEDAYDR